MDRIARLCLILALSLGLVLPKMTAALAALAPGSVRSVVICTGQGLVTVRLDARGAPVSDGPAPDHCALVHAADTAVPPIPGALGSAALVLPRTASVGRVIRRRSLPWSHAPRAPPMS